jgi:hypothetical protein
MDNLPEELKDLEVDIDQKLNIPITQREKETTNPKSNILLAGHYEQEQ